MQPACRQRPRTISGRDEAGFGVQGRILLLDAAFWSASAGFANHGLAAAGFSGKGTTQSAYTSRLSRLAILALPHMASPCGSPRPREPIPRASPVAAGGGPLEPGLEPALPPEPVPAEQRGSRDAERGCGPLRREAVHWPQRLQNSVLPTTGKDLRKTDSNTVTINSA